MHAACLSGDIRILLALDPSGTGIGEDGLQEEPDQGWLQINTHLERFCFVNAAEEAVKHVTPFLLCGPHGGAQRPESTTTADTTPPQPQVHWSLQLWNSGRRHESLSFEECRLAGYTPRVLSVFATIIAPFRPPAVRYWTHDMDLAAFWDWGGLGRLLEDELTRRGPPPSVVVEESGRPTSLSTSFDNSLANPPSPTAVGASTKLRGGVVRAVPCLLEGWWLRYFVCLERCEVLLIANPEDAESAMLLAEVSATALVACAPKTGEAIDLQVGSLTLVPAVLDRDRRWLPSQTLSATFPMALHEGPRGAGLWRAKRKLLKPLQATLHYSLESRRAANALAALSAASSATTTAVAAAVEAQEEEDGPPLVLHHSPSRRRRIVSEQTGSPWDAEARIPRCVWLDIRQAQFSLETTAGAAAGGEGGGVVGPAATKKAGGLITPALVVRCGGETRLVRAIAGTGGGGNSSSSSNNKGKATPPSSLPSSPMSSSLLPLAAAAAASSSSLSWAAMFEAALEFVTAEMSSQGDVEVILDVVDLGPPKKVEDEEEEWPVVATGALLLEPPLDDDEDEDNGSGRAQGPSKGYRQKREVVLTGLGPWEGLAGRLQVEVEMGLRLLAVTVHGIQHLLTLTEEAGREARPFLEVSVGELHSQTDQLSGLPDETIEHEMIFAAEDTAPALSVELKTLEGRVHERVRAQAMLAVGRGTKDQGLLPLKDPKGTVLCEVCVSVHWIDNLDALAASAAIATISKAGGAISSQPVAFAQALSTFQRQSFVMEPEAAIVQTISVDLSEVSLKGTEMDLAVLVATLQNFRKKPSARSALSGGSAAGGGVGGGGGGTGGTLPRRISRIKSMSQIKDVADGDARERWWKRTIYGIFKEVDTDRDGRLSRSEVVEMLHRVAADLYLTHSEAAVQIDRLLHSMGWAAGGEGGKEGGVGDEEQAMSWPGFREALVRAVEVYEFEHAGWLFNSVRCREFASVSVLRKAFPGLALAQASSTYYTNFSSSSLSAAAARQSLAAHLARLEPGPPDALAAFWKLLEHETGARRGEMDLGVHVEPGQSPSQAHAALQAMLVRALKNYKVTKDAWRLLVVPALHGLPALRGVDRDGYEVMGAPVSVGDAVYSDIKGAELIALPPALASQVLTGLRTPHRDRKARGPRVVSLHLNEAATLYVCYDRAIPKIPTWLTGAGFRNTRIFVRTTMAMYRVWVLTTPGPGRIVLGGNEGFGKGKGREKQAFECFNYFVLMGAAPGASPPAMAVPLPARWLLQENSPAYLGGQPLHDHLFAALGVGGARLAPLRSANAKETAGKEEGEGVLAAGSHLHMEYNFHLHCPGIHLGLLDGRKFRSSTSKLAVWTQAVTANISLERPLDAEEASWLGLGRTDRLEGDLELVSLAASYFNPSLSTPELVVEPWGCRCVMRNRLDSAITTVRVDAPRHLNLNISPSLADVLRGVWRPLRFDPRRYRGSFEETPTDVNRIVRVVLLNRLGVPLTLRPASFGCRIMASSQPQQQEQGEEEEKQQSQEGKAAAAEDVPPLEDPRLVVLEEGGQVELLLEQPSSSQQAASSGCPAAAGFYHRVDLEPLGWKRVAQVHVGLAGAQAYHLSPAHRHRAPSRPGSAPSNPSPAKELPPGGRALSPNPAHKRKPSNSSQQQHSSSHADVSLSHKILMVVDAKEHHASAETGQGSITAAALHVEVRTNVRLMNLTGVVVDAKLGRGGDGVRDFLLPHGTMTMPLSIVRQQPMLSLRRLAQDDYNHETHSPGMGMEDSGVLLHPALFDVRTHEALRRTRGLEERSLSLHHRVLGTVAARADDIVRVELDEAKPLQEGGESKPSTTEESQQQQQKQQQQEQQQQQTPEKKTVKSPSVTPEASAAPIKIAHSLTTPLAVAVDWTLAILPPYQLSNTLPCLIEVEAFQPKHLPQRRTRPRSRSGDGKGNASGLPTSSLSLSSSASSSAVGKRRADPASDLFSLPMGLMPLVSSASDARSRVDNDDSQLIAKGKVRSVHTPTSPGGGREGMSDDGEQDEAEIVRATDAGEMAATVLGPAEDMEVVWGGRLESGNHANLELVKLDRALYIRVRLMGETHPGPWSVPVHIPSWTHLDRVAFNEDRESGSNEGLEVSWMDGGGEYHGDIRFVRRWRLKGARRLAVCADYWILNKTGLALTYQPTPVPDTGGRTGSPRFDEAAAGNDNGEATEPVPRHSPLPPEWAVAAAAAGVAAEGAERRLISDGMHRACFGRTTRLPLLLGCPAKTLRTMPYALSHQAMETPLYLSELRVDGKDRALPAVVHRCRDLDFPLFADSDLRVVELPAPLQEAMRRPDGLLCVLRDRWRRDLTLTEQQEQQNGTETTVFTVSEDSYVYVFCCVKDGEGEGKEEGGRARPPPAWLSHEGFRVPPNSGPLLTSESRTRYVPYRRFYSKGSTVRLGGPRRSGSAMAGSAPPPPGADNNSIDLSRSGASTTSSVEDHHQQQQQLLLKPPPPLQLPSALSSVAEEGDSNQEATATTAVVVKPKGGKSPKAKAGEPVEVQVILVVARAQEEEGTMELDVRQVEVERSISDRMLCSRQYALLPRFGLGDPLYVDRKASDYALQFLPPALTGLPLLAIHTAQGDKRGGNSFALSFSARRPCTVLVAYDGRAKSVPDWLSRLGFEATEWTIPGPKGEFAFKLYRRTIPAHATLRLGGNNAQGARGPKTMYLVWLAPLLTSSGFATTVSPAPTPRSRASSMEVGGWHQNELLNDSSNIVGLVAGKKGSSEEKDDDLSLYWDSQENGRLRILAPPFDTLGRDWSSLFNVDAISTTGQLETPSAVLGVSVKSLPGLFHRTRAVTLWPRFVVINRLHEAVDVLPLLRPTYLDVQAGGGSSSRVLRGTVASILNRSSSTVEKMATAADKKAKSKAAAAGNGASAGASSNASAATSSSSTTKGHLAAAECYGVLHPGECMVVYGFLPLRSLPSNLLLPPRLNKARIAALQQQHTLQSKDEDKDGPAVARALCFRLHDTQARDETEQMAFSHAVLTEGVGETCVWFWRDAKGMDAGPLISANVDVHASTVFMTLRDSTLSPPYRIENRSSWAFLRCKQSGISGDTLSVGPMAFKSFSWQERDHLHQLKVSVEECEGRGGGAGTGAAALVVTADFSLDEVGPKETLIVPGKAFLGGTGGGVGGVGGGGTGLGRGLHLKTRRSPQQKLYAHVSTAGRTRVITFSDMAWAEMQSPRKEMALSSWTWSLFQELYNSLDVHVGLTGLTLNLLDMDPSGRRVVELLSLTLDRLEASKEGGKDRAQLALYHVQVDDMRPHAILPVVLQPADSGWHTPIRRSGRSKLTAAAAGGGGGGGGSAEKGKRPLTQKEEKGPATSALVPLIRVMAEPELHTPWSEVVHFRGLELGVQELEVHLDLDALLSLVAYIGRLSAPDPEREEAAAAAAGIHYHHQHQRHQSPHSLRTSAGIDDKSLSLVRRLLRSKVCVPEVALGEAVGQRLVYIELFHHSSLIVGLELVPGAGTFPSRREKNKQAAAAAAAAGGRVDGGMSLDPDLDEALVSGLELIGTGVVQLLADMARSLAQLSGLTLVFNELLLTHYFGSHYDLGHIIALSLRQQALTQSYKLLGAMDLLGNPLNLFLGFGSGVVEFFRRTQAEMVGDADSKGEGLRRLAKAIIGGPFSSVSKITGTVASLLEEVVGVRGEAGGGGMGGGGGDEGMSSASSAAGGHAEGAGGGGGAGGRAAPPQHLGEGILKGGEVFYRSMKSGVKNIYDLPQQGASREGFAGFLKGMGKGVVGALAAPLIGTLGGISRVTDTTAYFDKPKVLRRRRAARVAAENQVLPLLELRDMGEEREEGEEEGQEGKKQQQQQQEEEEEEFKRQVRPTET